MLGILMRNNGGVCTHEHKDSWHFYDAAIIDKKDG
jgi:hypothetical protein